MAVQEEQNQAGGAWGGLSYCCIARGSHCPGSHWSSRSSRVARGTLVIHTTCTSERQASCRRADAASLSVCRACACCPAACANALPPAAASRCPPAHAGGGLQAWAQCLAEPHSSPQTQYLLSEPPVPKRPSTRLPPPARRQKRQPLPAAPQACAAPGPAAAGLWPLGQLATRCLRFRGCRGEWGEAGQLRQSKA